MLIFIFLFALIRNLQGAPLTESEANIQHLLNQDGLLPRSEVIFGKRETSDIILSCLATIFACTWTAIHPNIPAPNDSQWELLTRRISTSVAALLAPELITTWALRQHIAAKRIADEYNKSFVKSAIPLSDAPLDAGPDSVPLLDQSAPSDAGVSASQPPPSTNSSAPKSLSSSTLARFAKTLRTGSMWLPKKIFCRPLLPEERRPGEIQPWTTAHGFLVQMGGFVVSRNGKPVETLRFNPHKPDTDIAALIRDKTIAAPTITEAEINDRSKGDFLSKTVVIGHTTWFLAQCIARWATGLPVTKFEVITLGFVVLNGMTYAFWWHKPQDVGVPVYLEWISTTEEPTQAARLTKPSEFRKDIKKAWKNRTCNICHLFAEIIAGVVMITINPLVKLAIYEPDKETLDLTLRVPMFHYEESGSNVLTLAYPMAAIATVFGSVHLIPIWLDTFHSPTQMHVWKVSAIVITGTPLLFALLTTAHQYWKTPQQPYNKGVLEFTAIVGLCYYAARISLLIVSVVSLTTLPPRAFLTIQWISVFPHL